MRILGYSYNATIVCPHCAHYDHEAGRITRMGHVGMQYDQHELPDDLEDHHGNPVRPVFSTDEGAHDETCGVCFDRLEWSL